MKKIFSLAILGAAFLFLNNQVSFSANNNAKNIDNNIAQMTAPPMQPMTSPQRPITTPQRMQIQQGNADLVETALQTRQVNILIDAINQAGLSNTLRGPGVYTIFAPADQAFKALPDATLNNLMQPGNEAQLQQVLKLHVVSGCSPTSQLRAGTSIPTLEGDNLQISRRGNEIYVNGAKIVRSNICAKNGIIHVIDQVMLPR